MKKILLLVCLLSFLGNAHACYDQNLSDDDNHTNCRKSAEQGNADGQYNLGIMYTKGQGITQDDKKAVKWYRKSAEQGNADAQYNLGVMYDNGQGVTQDYKKAVKWYRKSAEQGTADAQSNLGAMYANGQGITQDYVMAKMLWNIAAAKGHETALKNRDLIAKNMTSSQIEKAQDLANQWMETH